MAFTIFVDPGRRVYVRKININGNVKTRDEVIRREIPPAGERLVRRRPHRTLEDPRPAPRLLRATSTSKRLRCPAPWTRSTSSSRSSKEHRQPPRRRRLLELGRDRVQRVGVAAEHLRQSGNSLTAGINTSKVNRNIAVTFTEPYWTVDGVSRTLEVYTAHTRLDVPHRRALPVGDARRSGGLRHPDLGNRHDQLRFRVSITRV